MMVASVSGRQALGLSRPLTVSRISKPGSVSVAGASTLRILRSNAGLGLHLRFVVIDLWLFYQNSLFECFRVWDVM